jgi:hypothetical protein
MVGGQGEAYLCGASVDAHLPKNSAGSTSVAGCAPEADERAEQECLLERAWKAVVSHPAQPAPKMRLALLSCLLTSILLCDAPSLCTNQ